MIGSAVSTCDASMRPNYGSVVSAYTFNRYLRVDINHYLHNLAIKPSPQEKYLLGLFLQVFCARRLKLEEFHLIKPTRKILAW